MTCEPVVMEMLAGVPPRQVATAERALDAFRSLSIDEKRDFRAAGYLYARLRAEGRTVRGIMDCLIAHVAMCHEAVLVHTDRDFETIAAVSDLQQRWLPGI